MPIFGKPKNSTRMIASGGSERKISTNTMMRKLTGFQPIARSAARPKPAPIPVMTTARPARMVTPAPCKISQPYFIAISALKKVKTKRSQLLIASAAVMT